MTQTILVVTDAYEAMRYKKFFPDILTGAKVLFSDEGRGIMRTRGSYILYYTDTVRLDCELLQGNPSGMSPTLLSIESIF